MCVTLCASPDTGTESDGRTMTTHPTDKRDKPMSTKGQRKPRSLSGIEVDPMVEDALVSMPPAFIKCRHKGHDLRENTAELDHRNRIAHTTHKCRSCKVIRHQEISMTSWLVLRSWYTDYPPGYLMLGMGRMDRNGRAVVRREYVMGGAFPITNSNETRSDTTEGVA